MIAAWEFANPGRKTARGKKRRKRIQNDPVLLEKKRAQGRAQYVPAVATDRECPVCMVVFSVKGRRVYCSKRCSNKAESIREKGWTIEAYQADLQSGVCQACDKPHKGRMAVDHCPENGGRGLIHQRCNVGIAQAHHDPEELFRWSVYLVRHSFDLRELLA